MPLTVISLDPGIGRCGWAILKKNQSDIIPLEYNCIETSPKKSLETRLKIIFDKLQEIIEKYQPSTMVLEQLFFNTNQKTAITIGQAQGVMLLAASKNNLKVVFLTPLQIKSAVTGYGVAEKEAVKKMILMSLKLKTVPKLDDTFDALACGMAYLYNCR